MIRPKYRHAPQGAQRIDNPDYRDYDAIVDKEILAMKALPNDPDVHHLSGAVEARDDAEIKRLIPILKARYGDKWTEIGRNIMISNSRWPGGKRKRTTVAELRAELVQVERDFEGLILWFAAAIQKAGGSVNISMKDAEQMRSFVLHRIPGEDGNSVTFRVEPGDGDAVTS